MPEHDSLSRRRVLIATGSAVTAGGIGLALASGGADAQITGDLSIPPSEFAGPDGDPHTPVVHVDGQFSYQTPDAVASWRVELQVSTPTTTAWETIDQASGQTSKQQLQHDYTVSGAVVSASAWSSSDFDAPDGQSVTVTVPVRVFLMVATPDNMAAASAQETATPTVTVTDEGLQRDATVAGSGNISWQRSA